MIERVSNGARTCGWWKVACVAALAALLAGCSGDEDADAASDKAAGDGEGQQSEHVWKEKTRTIDQARDVGRQLGEAAARNKAAAQ